MYLINRLSDWAGGDAGTLDNTIVLVKLFIAVMLDKFDASMRNDSLDIHEEDFKSFKFLFRSLTSDERPDILNYTELWKLMAGIGATQSHEDGGENPFSPPEIDSWSEQEEVSWKRSLPGSSSCTDVSFSEVKSLAERLYNEADSPLNKEGQAGYVVDWDEED